ncbi:hypothetical protein Pcinc_003876 [Petrolisthes cinctipes]|uniref:Uncharacterized protein n=1 Tax=Petrolisthes cinctipes TaxID=88211 RepID=A0AAE1L489_PETCI|nr:hypothetical protein Pcinc_003876 [Petrolisthes cinctipes]
MVPNRPPPDLDLTSDLLTTSDYQQKTTEREVLASDYQQKLTEKEVLTSDYQQNLTEKEVLSSDEKPETTDEVTEKSTIASKQKTEISATDNQQKTTDEVTENSLSYEESVKGVSEALGILVKAHLEENLKVFNKSLSQEWLVNLINVNTTPITTTLTPSHSPHAHTPSYTLLTTMSSHSPHAHVATHTPRTNTPTPSHSPHAHKHKASIRHDHFHSIYSALVTLMRGTTAEGTEGDETHRNRVEGNIVELNTTTEEGVDEGEARAPQFTKNRTPRTTTRKDNLLKTNTDEGADDKKTHLLSHENQNEFLEHLHDEGAPNPHPQQVGTPTYDSWKVKEALYSLSDAVSSDPEAALHIMLRFGVGLQAPPGAALGAP